MDGPFLADTFALLPEAAAIGKYLIESDAEQRFAFVRQARIAYILQQPQLMLRGQSAAAVIGPCKVQGSNRMLFEFLVAKFARRKPLDPLDFLIHFDAAEWERRKWNQERGASGYLLEREALVYHELCHLRQLTTTDGTPRFHDDGREMLATSRHTYEFFSEEIVRYGPATLGLEQVGTDYVAGAKAEKARRGRRQQGPRAA